MATPFNVWQGVQSGQQLVDGLFKQQDQMRAGRALAGGNYADAMKALGAGGDVQGVRQIQADQVAAEGRDRATADRAKAKQLATTRQIVTGLSRAAREGADVGLLLNEYKPTFLAMGTKPEEYDAIAAQVRENPAILDNFGSLIDREIQVINLGNGGWASVDKATGQRVAGDSPYIRPTVVGDVAINPDQSVLFDARQNKYFEVEGADGSPRIVSIDPQGQSDVAYQGEARGPAVRTLSAEEVAAAGLAPGVYQQSRDGKIDPVGGQGGDRLSAGQQRQVETYYQDIASIDNIDAELGRFDAMIENGSLELSPVSNAIGGVRNTLGISSENSRNLAEFRSTLEKVRNDSLRLNSGVQTEGDAKRAWDELIANINDPAIVRRQLQRIKGINSRARQFRQQRINALEGGSRQPAQGGQAAPRVNFTLTPAQQQRWSSLSPTGTRGTRTYPILINPETAAQSFNNVPKGGYFITPDGELRGPKP